MRRELRRHPVQQVKPTRGSNRPLRMPRSANVTRAGAAAPARRARFLPAFLQRGWTLEVWSELKKVQWPTRQETLNLTLVVLVVAAALGIFLGGLDFIFNWLLEQTLLR